MKKLYKRHYYKYKKIKKKKKSIISNFKLEAYLVGVSWRGFVFIHIFRQI